MAAETPSALQGFLVPHPKVTSARLDATSTYTQAGPTAGVPVPAQDTDLVLTASGDQTAGTTLQVVAQSPSAFRWKRSTDGVTEWRGWDPPVGIAAPRAVESVSASAPDGRLHPHAVTLPNGKVLVVTTRDDGTTSYVMVYVRATSGVFANEVNVHTEPSTVGYYRPAALVVLPSGRVLCYSATYTASRWQIRADYSDDDGSTWAAYSARCLSTSIAVGTAYPLQMRGAYTPSGIVLLVRRDAGGAVQYASTDGGTGFTLVGQYTSATLEITSVDVVATASGLVAALAVEWGAETRLDVFAFPLGAPTESVFTPFGSISYSGASSTSTDPSVAPWVLYHNIAVTPMYASIALAVQENGTDVVLYCVLAPPSAAFPPYASAALSSDEGATWRRMGQTDAQEVDRSVISTDGFWYESAADSAYPWDICATWQRGRALMYHNASQRSAAPTRGGSLYEASFGGYSTHTLPSVGGNDSPRNGMVFGHTWAAIETPANNGYTGTGTASADAFDAITGAWEISTLTPDDRVYTASPSIDPAVGLVLRATFRGDAGSARFGFSEAASDVQAEVTISVGAPTRMFFRDAVAGATLAQPAISTATWYEAVIWYKSGKVSAWYRAVDGGEDREWTVLAENQTLTGGAGLADSVYFGAPSGGTNTTYWREVQYGTSFADDYAEGFSNPADLRARPFSGSALYVAEGVSVASSSGPAATGDAWSIPTAYRYGVENIHARESRSPARTWRSVGTTSAESFIWTLDDFDGGPPSGLWAVYFDNINFPVADITFAPDVSLTWGTPVSVDFRTAFVFERKGSSVRPRVSGATATGPYLHENEAAGGWFQFPNGDVRQIAGNTAGWLTSGATVAELRPVFRLSGTDNGEDANGTGYVWWPRALVLLHHPNGGGDLSALRVRIRPSGGVAPPSGYHEAGLIMPGEVRVLGRSQDFGGRESHTTNVEVTEMPSGATRVKSRGLRRRAWNIRHDEGQIMHQTRGTTQGDYVLGTTTSGALPVAGARDTVWLLEGLHEEVNGPETPLVWIPYIPAGPPDAVVHLWQRTRGAGYGALGEDVTVENFRGSEQTGGVHRTGVTFGEIL